MLGPYISVVIPVYNGENYLREAINSVINQTYTNYELIVIDDGSIDSTWEIIESYGNKVRGFHKENSGVSSALNFAIEVMRGEWFAWLSHDDLWLPNKLERQVEWMQQHPYYAMYYCGSYSFTASKNRQSISLGTWYPKGKDLRKMTRPGCYISGITTIINKDCFQSVGKFNEKYKCVQDTDMWFRIACKYEISCLHEALAKTRIHSNQTGQIISARCKAESISRRLKILSETPISLYFPEINNPKSIIIIKVLLIQWAKLYVIYTRFCIKHDIPTIKMCIQSISKI
jgi:hypothetical protein